MEADWVMVFTTDAPYKAEIIVQVLAKHNIHAVSVNKKDSSYLAFGDDEVYVNQADSEKALQIIKNTEL
jgi:type III secretory pathway lipoprotein EscJ